jgi:hypothetical protein
MKLSQYFILFLGLRIKLGLKPFDASLKILFKMALVIFHDSLASVFKLVYKLTLGFIHILAVFFDILHSDLL